MKSFLGWLRLSAVALACSLPLLHAPGSLAETKPAASSKQAEKKQKAGDAKPDQLDRVSKRAQTQMNTGKLKDMFAALELTPEQHEQVLPLIADLYQERWAYLDEHREEITAAREAVKEAEASGNDKAITQARQAHLKFYSQGPQVKLEEVAQALQPVLNSDQAERLDAFLADNAKPQKKAVDSKANNKNQSKNQPENKPKKNQQQPAEPGE